MGYSRKWVNNTASPVALTITSTTEFTGYLGSVSISAYSALYATTDVPELDLAAGRGTVDKYLNNTKVYFPGYTGYFGSVGYTASAGYAGSRGYTGSATP